MKRLAIAVAAAALVSPVAAHAADSRGADELAVRSHGHRMRAALEYWEWCYEDSDLCQVGVADYAYNPNPRRLPFHRGSRMRITTGRPARAVTVGFEKGRRRATRLDDSGRRWVVRAPGGGPRRQTLAFDADYRYWKDGHRYGGVYSFFLFARLHRHR